MNKILAQYTDGPHTYAKLKVNGNVEEIDAYWYADKFVTSDRNNTHDEIVNTFMKLF